MDCESNVEKLVECARRRSEPAGALKAHLRACEPCLDRWEAEQELSAQLRIVRMEAGSRRSSPAVRQALINEFQLRQRKVAAPRWAWGFAMAAALLLAVGLFPSRTAAPVAPAPDTSLQQADADSDGFIAVPYAPPLATGELLRIVHTELNPAALASLGVSVDPAWNVQLPADVLEGEDGMPRAVRVSDVDSGEGGF